MHTINWWNLVFHIVYYQIEGKCTLPMYFILYKPSGAWYLEHCDAQQSNLARI